MATILEALRGLVAPDILQQGPLELRESDSKSTCPPTKIEQSGGQVVALRFEPRRFRGSPDLPINEWLFPLFNTTCSKPPICRSCDYILFYAPRDEPREIFVFPCELKSTWTKGTSAQLRNGLLMARYLLDVVGVYCDVKPFPTPRYRGIVFSSEGSRRGPLKVRGRREWVRDDRTDLEMTIERAGGGHHLQTFCV